MSTKLWTTKGYGKWLPLPESTDEQGRKIERCLVILDPGADTGMSVGRDKKDKDNLRPHPDTTQEKMTVIDYVAPKSQRFTIATIVRRFNTGAENDDGVVVTDKPLGPGQSMLTVEENGAGYWHVIENHSELPQLIRFEKTVKA